MFFDRIRTILVYGIHQKQKHENLKGQPIADEFSTRRSRPPTDNSMSQKFSIHKVPLYFGATTSIIEHSFLNTDVIRRHPPVSPSRTFCCNFEKQLQAPSAGFSGRIRSELLAAPRTACGCLRWQNIETTKHFPRAENRSRSYLCLYNWAPYLTVQRLLSVKFWFPKIFFCWVFFDCGFDSPRSKVVEMPDSSHWVLRAPRGFRPSFPDSWRPSFMDHD